MSSVPRSIRASSPRRGRTLLVRAAVLIGVLGAAAPAWAIPAFARKYKTSCTTCHTVFPKLTPFGEAFRRNGYRFPGVDSDAIKGDQVALGQDQYKKLFPNSVWPGSLSGFPPIAVGFNGQAIAHPDGGSSGAAADNGARFNLDTLVEEGHVWAGGSFDDSDTFFAELTFSADGVEVEHASVHFNDLIGPAHLVNVVAGKAMPTLTSFGPHSSYLADMAMPQVGVTALYGGASDPFVLDDNYNGFEVNGTGGGRFEYAVGLSAGPNADPRNSRNVHAQVGYKLGGMALDGEGEDGTASKAEESVTIDAFFSEASSHFENADGNVQRDDATTVGGAVRAQYDDLELDAGGYWQKDDHALADGTAASSLVQWDELSYVVYPWLVPAARVELVRTTPSGGAAVSDLRVIPGAAMLIRPNLKFVLTVPIERASGAPDAGWDAAGGVAAPATPTDKVGPEVEAVVGTLFYAF